MNNNKSNMENDESEKIYLDNLKYAPYKYKRVLTTDHPPNTYIKKMEGDNFDCSEECNNTDNCKMFIKARGECWFYSSTNTNKATTSDEIEYFVKNEDAFTKNIST